jgi:hypothetical protein
MSVVDPHTQMSNWNWFATDYDYSGYAEAIFEAPHVELHGPATVKPDEHGRPVVRMTVERSNPPIQSQFDLLEIEFGSRPTPGGGRVTAVGSGSQNRVRATIRGDVGVFCSGPDWNYTLSMPPGENLTLQIDPAKSEFVPFTSAPESLLVLPLANFISEFPTSPVTVCSHPLNVNPGTNPRSEYCIPFEVCGQKALILQLPGAEDEQERMRAFNEKMKLTAVAILPMVDPAMSDPWGWFLTTFLRLLELASGCEIGVPWIEVRDQSLRLVRRLHFAIGHQHHVTDGYGAITKPFHWSNGEYLTAALSAVEAREPFFSIAMRHVIRAGLPGLTLDDQLDHLVRALECLSARYGFGKQDLLDGFDALIKQAIRTVLNDAKKALSKLASAVPEAGLRTQVSRIAERAQSAAQTDRSFGLAVEKLVRHLGLLDAEVLVPHYASHPGPEGRDWIGTLSYYRGAVFHEGFVDIDSPGTQTGEVFGFILHLHDLVVRMLLKIVGYGGTYQPRLIRATAAETVDWFKPGIRVDSLLRVPTLGIK